MKMKTPHFILFCAALTCVGFNVTNAGELKISSDVPIFKEEAQPAGLNHKYTGPWEYFVGGGAAGFDCNGDRFPDLAIAGGSNQAKLYINESQVGGVLKFRATKALPVKAATKVTGFYPLDINNDGHKDLIVLRIGKNYLLEGGPNCSFKIANHKYSFDGGSAWSTGFSAIFEADNKFPTLAFGNYVDRSAPGSPWGTCHDNVLARPASGDVPNYSNPQALTPGYCSLSLMFTDWNRSGKPDLRITNDRQYYRGGQEQMWKIESDRPARPYRTADGWRQVLIWGMGIAETDLDSDGFPEYALTSMGDTKLQTLEKDGDELRPVYRDMAFDLGATAHRPHTGGENKPSTGWHVEFADFNNDGRSDLFIAKGNVEAMPDFASFDPDNLLLMQADGKFMEAGAVSGIALNRRGRGAVVADLNMDGMLDLVVINREAPVSLFRNLGAKADGKTRAMGNWLGIELRQKGPNTDAIGALISIKTGNTVRTRRVKIGGGHASGHLGFSHVGLGVAERASIRIKWPDGNWSHPYRVFANKFVVIDRDAESAKYWFPLK